MKKLLIKAALAASSVCMIVAAAAVSGSAQEVPPAPGPPKTGQIPVVREKKLPNGLTVATGERRAIPLVTVQLLVKSAASDEDISHAGLANLTASLLTKGTKTRTATQIAEQIEFLGGSISSGAGWNSSAVFVTVTSDKLDQALSILADVVMNPAFADEELALLKSQTLDGLTYNLKQPGFLANYVSSRYSFGEHPVGGTPESIERIGQQGVAEFHKLHYTPSNSVLIFAGDVTAARANSSAVKFFGKWRAGTRSAAAPRTIYAKQALAYSTPRRILVVDLPNSGQAAVKYTHKLDVGRVQCKTTAACSTTDAYFPALVMNSVLGGGYSSRLNQEIRIKRGLSYGAGSSFSWRDSQSNFSTSTQTKSESAAEVARLVLDEVARLGDKPLTGEELDPRKLVLSGDFGRDLETTAGLANMIADLYSFGLRPVEMNAYVRNVRSVTDAQIRQFAGQSLMGGDVVIVGDAKLFMDDLKKRFPDLMINTIAASDLDLNKESLRK